MAKKSDEIKRLEADVAAYEKNIQAASETWSTISKIVNKTLTDQAALNNAETEYNNLLRAQEAAQARINKLQEKHYNTVDSLQGSLTDYIQGLRKVQKGNEKIKDQVKDLRKFQRSINKQLDSGKELTDDQLKKLFKIGTEYENMDGKVKTVNERIRELYEVQEAANKSANDFLGDVSKGIGKLPVIGESLSKGFDTFINSKYADNLKKKLAEKMFDPKTIGKTFKGALGLGIGTVGMGLMLAGIKAGLAREQELKDQQRSIGLTKEQTVEVDKMQRGLLNSSKSMVVSLEEARKAYSELVDDFGVTAAADSEMVSQQVALTKAYGLQAEEATNLQKAAMINGQSTEEMKINILATAEGFNKAKGSSYSLSSVMKTVSKLSDSIRLQFRGSNTELTAAVMKAKALGTTLEDLNGIADGLLNIESSIESQVTAQLVTGRNINMDKARMFALMDDMPGLMDELVKQEIDYAAYSKMNRIEKQSTAAALGMNTEQMAKFVSQQELSKQLGIDMSNTQNQTAAGLENSLKSRQAEIAQLAKAGNMAALQYEKDNESLTKQEKMTAAIEQMVKAFQAAYKIVILLGAAMTIYALAANAAAISSMLIGVGVSAGLATPLLIAGGIAVAALAGGAIAGMASGGEVVGGSGPVVVGENGPEIVRLKKGNVVTPNDQLTNLASNNKPAPAPIVNVSLVVGNTAINEIGNKISMNQNYNQGVGNTYNRLG
jgi:hypothetical protein